MIRRLAREVALQALFQIDFTGNEVEQAVDAALDEHEELHPEAAVDKALDQHKELGAASARNYVKKYSMVLVNGVVENKEAIDATLNSCATDWTVERMPATDRNILRVAVFEMRHEKPALAAGVAINEAVEIAKAYGTDEDLWAFNEEITVKAVAASKIPVVSAVGHETDFTLCDFAADVRAATPSQAAELVVADVEGYKQRVAYLEQRARSLLSALLTQQQRRLDNLVNSWALRDPERLFADQSQRLDTASCRLREALELHLQQDEHKLALAAARLDSLSPLAVLGRGYSVSQKSDYTLVSSVDDLRWGDELLTTVADGVITSVVQQVERR